MAKELLAFGLQTIPEIRPGDRLADIISDSLHGEGIGLQQGDIVVVTSKIASKALGRLVSLSTIKPSAKAMAIAKVTGKDARRVEVILQECEQVIGFIKTRNLDRDPQFIRSYFGSASATELLQKTEAVLLTRMSDGRLATDAGTDLSNVPGTDVLSLLPSDPMGEARRLRSEFEKRFGCGVGVILADTEIRALRQGTSDIAIGISGLPALSRRFGAPDIYGKPKFGGLDGIADQVANLAALLTGQADERVPVVVVRGLAFGGAVGEGTLGEAAGAESDAALPVGLLVSFIKGALRSRLALTLGIWAYKLGWR